MVPRMQSGATQIPRRGALTEAAPQTSTAVFRSVIVHQAVVLGHTPTGTATSRLDSQAINLRMAELELYLAFESSLAPVSARHP
jgi:hypothetical protein